ncbi:MAG: hypothetical protein LBP57_00060 [Endomicrobium sp.]|nr:hypothetical protein [Endomicrobium sp.]
MAMEDFSIEYIVETYTVQQIEARITELEEEDKNLPFPIHTEAIGHLKNALTKARAYSRPVRRQRR